MLALGPFVFRQIETDKIEGPMINVYLCLVGLPT